MNVSINSNLIDIMFSFSLSCTTHTSGVARAGHGAVHRKEPAEHHARIPDPVQPREGA
jgi:hypothetical protein